MYNKCFVRPYMAILSRSAETVQGEGFRGGCWGGWTVRQDVDRGTNELFYRENCSVEDKTQSEERTRVTVSEKK